MTFNTFLIITLVASACLLGFAASIWNRYGFANLLIRALLVIAAVANTIIVARLF